MSTENEKALAGVEANLAAGMVRIGEQMALLNGVVVNGGAACQERVDLWDLEMKQARLTDRHAVILDHIEHAEASLTASLSKTKPR